MNSIVEKCGRVLKVWCIVEQKEVVRNIVEHCGDIVWSVEHCVRSGDEWIGDE